MLLSKNAGVHMFEGHSLLLGDEARSQGGKELMTARSRENAGGRDNLPISHHHHSTEDRRQTCAFLGLYDSDLPPPSLIYPLARKQEKN